MLGMWGKTTADSSPHSFYIRSLETEKRAFGVKIKKNFSFEEKLVPTLNDGQQDMY